MVLVTACCVLGASAEVGIAACRATKAALQGKGVAHVWTIVPGLSVGILVGFGAMKVGSLVVKGVDALLHRET